MVKARWVLAVAISAALAAAAGWWIQGRPARALAAAERAIGSGDRAMALAWLDLAESDRMTREDALLLRARVALMAGHPDEAVAPLNRVRADGPRAADAALWKGRTLYSAGQTLLSIGWFRLAAQLRPADAEARRWLAAAAYDQGAVTLAVAALAAVTRLCPTDARAWRTLATIQRDYGHLDLAGIAYRETLRLDPDQPAVRLEYAGCLAAGGAFEDAEGELARCRGRVDEPHWAYMKASCLRGRGEVEAFKGLVRESADRFPNHAGLLGFRGSVERLDGRWDEAVRWLDRAVAADPFSAEHWHQRGLVLAGLGRKEEAARDRGQAGRLIAATRDLSRLDERASRRPDDAGVRCQLGRTCSLLGKTELAVSWYRAALACDPANVEARAGLRALRPRRAGPGRVSR
jgi:tetratricopeptide (TPR) repeat protein